MSQQERELRRAAAQAFMESLDQLQQTLEPSESPPKPAYSSQRTVKSPSIWAFDLNSFEDAIADIDQFIEQSQNSDPE